MLLPSSLRLATCAIRPLLSQCRCLPVSPPHVSLSRPLRRAFASWGIPPTCGLRLVACSAKVRAKSHRGLLRPERPFDVTLGWHFTPGSVCEWRDDQCASSPRNHVLLDPAYQPLERVGWLCMTTPQCAFTCVIHSHLLGASLRRLEVYRRLSHALRRLITSRTTLGDAVT